MSRSRFSAEITEKLPVVLVFAERRSLDLGKHGGSLQLAFMPFSHLFFSITMLFIIS
jgi:hypothetical protein